jgi:superfamily II DNA/RNA helicase
MMLQSTFAFASLRTRAIGTLFRVSFSSTVEVSPSDHGTFSMKDFASSILDRRIIKSLRSSSMNITKPTPIQSHSLPLLFRNHDVMASSATGSGKTLMFGLPLLNKLMSLDTRITSKKLSLGSPTALIISPTRELAVQTSNVLNTFLESDATLKNDIVISLGKNNYEFCGYRFIKVLTLCNSYWWC